MRILIITACFPPRGLEAGGSVAVPVAERLALGGESVCVLTDHRRFPGQRRGQGFPFGVRRELVLLNGGKRAARHRITVHNRFVTARAVSQWSPDAILVFNLHAISLGPAQAAEESELPVLYGLADENLAEYLPPRFSLFPRRLTGFLLDRIFYRGDTVTSLKLSNAFCTSGLLKLRLLGSGAPVAHAAVIHEGVACDRLESRELGAIADPPRLLAVLRLDVASGAHTLLGAMRILERGGIRTTLTLAGGERSAAYVAYLERLASRMGLRDRVAFAGTASHGELLRLYRAHDVFVFPAERPDTLGIRHLEAMACGLPVVTTLVGAQREFLRADVNALCCSTGDPEDLARSLRRVLIEPELRRRLAAGARSLVETSYNLDRYVEDLRLMLAGITQGRAVSA